jgi:hypothetical protein
VPLSPPVLARFSVAPAAFGSLGAGLSVSVTGSADVPASTNVMMWENQKIYPRFGYELVERRVEGVYDRLHYRKRLD